jgi:hypothetical protein
MRDKRNDGVRALQLLHGGRHGLKHQLLLLCQGVLLRMGRGHEITTRAGRMRAAAPPLTLCARWISSAKMFSRTSESESVRR